MDGIDYLMPLRQSCKAMHIETIHMGDSYFILLEDLVSHAGHNIRLVFNHSSACTICIGKQSGGIEAKLSTKLIEFDTLRNGHSQLEN